MKKLLAAMIIGAFTLGGIGCSGEKEKKKETTTETKTDTKTTTKTETKTETK